MVVEYLGKNLLFLDLSSTCTGYTIATFDKDKSEATIIKSGAFWYAPDITHGVKYHNVCQFIIKLCEENDIEGVVLESYFVNPYQTGGCSVVPELQGAVKAFLQVLDKIPTCSTYPPQSWRASCGIKKTAGKVGAAAWKIPTKEKTQEILNIKFPEKVLSNITGKKRAFPFDISDSIGIAIGWLKASPNNCKTFKIKEGVFNNE